MKTQDLPTPAVMIDLPAVRRNIEMMASYTKQHGLGLRPHTKTHKMLEIGRMQREAGAIGLCVAKIGEAEVMAAVSADNLLIAYPMVGAERVRRLVELARTANVTVALDDELALRPISEAADRAGATVGILVEMDVGTRRMGLASPEQVVELAKVVDGLPGAEFLGLQTYSGHIRSHGDERAAALKEVDAKQREVLDLLTRAGLEAAVVSGGTTPTALHSHLVPTYTDIRPGTNIFFDAMCVTEGFCQIDQCALSVEFTVISTAVSDQMILDGGGKALAMDRVNIGDKGFGIVLQAPDAKIRALNEEHAFVDLSGCRERFRVGDRVRVVPAHVCNCVNMHDRIHVVDGYDVIDQWKVASRGMIV